MQRLSSASSNQPGNGRVGNNYGNELCSHPVRNYDPATFDHPDHNYPETHESLLKKISGGYPAEASPQTSAERGNSRAPS